MLLDAFDNVGTANACVHLLLNEKVVHVTCGVADCYWCRTTAHQHIEYARGLTIHNTSWLDLIQSKSTTTGLTAWLGLCHAFEPKKAKYAIERANTTFPAVRKSCASLLECECPFISSRRYVDNCSTVFFCVDPPTALSS